MTLLLLLGRELTLSFPPAVHYPLGANAVDLFTPAIRSTCLCLFACLSVFHTSFMQMKQEKIPQTYPGF